MIIIAKDHREFLQLQSLLAAVKYEMKQVRAILLARKAGFRPDQPRDEEGKWTTEFDDNASGDSTGSVVLSDESPSPLLSGAQYAQAVQVVIHESALTGISTIDETTKKLATTLEGVLEVVNILPGQTRQQYGVAVHTAFAIAVRAQNLEGIGSSGVELSFFNGDQVRYGFPDSVRTDVILRNAVGDPIAIYDVKTGAKELNASRISELREKSGATSSVPIIQMHVGNGVTRKGMIRLFRPFDLIYIYRKLTK